MAISMRTRCDAKGCGCSMVLVWCPPPSIELEILKLQHTMISQWHQCDADMTVHKVRKNYVLQLLCGRL